MDLIAKKELFTKFLEKWGEQLEDIPAILKYLMSYPEIKSELKEVTLIDINDIHNSQLEWVSLVAQLDNPIETTFFKEYWIPINKYRYDYFIDVSSSNLPLFAANFFDFEPHRWYKKYVYKEISQFLNDIDKPNFSFKEHFKELNDSKEAEVNSFHKERDELGFAGKLKLRPIDKDNFFDIMKFSNFSYNKNSIKFTSVNSLIVDLLPHECSIQLKSIDAFNNEKEDVCKKVKNIKSLLYFLQSRGSSGIRFFYIQFGSDEDCRGIFKNNTFKITHKDDKLLKAMIEKYKTYKE
ncbi:MAG: hypothetical protein COZ16_11115 [Flavobacteriaceae bacterium CG_4_10_14_3_um_filter_31_253]|nr:MAG: hypothetical protein COW43_07000 [Flavobacteriaceae bacterium CG17_big_fil_post_rev_8_21_14_2_50_31_13]PIX13806.1 MAG: hypothetical protein COZ74_04740 [Flavobacteriaceae bacterium CG_4_8_14_3_um_filter_31_8]PIY14022.1 MAG: hypothetical protein COZ16_11115 [Flavobacteriaceae bacterium CG_4_10_14_3_um_filter_31_253]PIZ09333.1 MAG: hypothetical protein COY55_13170 [Flavobacteriaceae bacterium CG_4_10_14_0_8_um_filter_31_99]PJC10618.1 MAG: hypothetical protein CO067_03510 [Flavobacteriacea